MLRKREIVGMAATYDHASGRSACKPNAARFTAFVST